MYWAGARWPNVTRSCHREPQDAPRERRPRPRQDLLSAPGGPTRADVARVLEGIDRTELAAARWFGAKGREIKSTEIVEQVPIPGEGRSAQPLGHLVLVHVEYTEGDPDTYVMTGGIGYASFLSAILPRR